MRKSLTAIVHRLRFRKIAFCVLILCTHQPSTNYEPLRREALGVNAGPRQGRVMALLDTTTPLG